MKVILLEPLENLGDVGQVVDVKPGYARNYLLPRGLAVLATESNLKALRARIRAQAKRLAERKAEAERLKEILENLTLTIPVRAGRPRSTAPSPPRTSPRPFPASTASPLTPSAWRWKSPSRSLGSTSSPTSPTPRSPSSSR